jgi:DNA recombination protein RmuC
MTPLEIALLLTLVGAGVAGMWLLRERYRLAAERELARRRLDDAKADETRMRESFRALAAETLQASSAQFLQLAERTLAARESKAVAEMDKRQSAVDQLVKPIEAALKRTEGELRKLERERTKAYAGLKAQVKGIAATNAELSRETGKLARALGKPNVRGRYGEIQLQRVAELAGMQEYCDFALQAKVRDEEGRLKRPDMVVRLPNERVLAVDAKTSLEAYVEALDESTPEKQKALLRRFADHVARQATELSKKAYWRDFTESPEFVVMFVPGDQFVDAALKHRPDLIELCAQKNVILASPSTLIGLLRAVHVGWHEKRLSDSARELFELGKELHERAARAMLHAEQLGSSLDQTLQRYNKFVASVDRRLIPTLRKFEERGVRVGEPVHELRPIEGTVRPASAGALQPEQGDMFIVPQNE